MDIAKIPQLVRNTGRLQEVVAVLLRYGLAPWLTELPGEWIQRKLQTGGGETIGEMTQPQRIRHALAELGTTYIKLGQILSTRADLVGPELAAELSQLQSSTTPDAADIVVKTIETELGRSTDVVFRDFETTAMASASIGQVHRATLPNGTRVVVKVQHDGIEDRINNDLEILIELARAAEAYAPQLTQYRPLATAQEFRKTLLAELDFTREQRNLARFARNFADDDGVRFPTPFPEFCSPRVLTMELMEGITVANKDQLAQSGFDLTDLAQRGANMFVQMVFRDGFYHADPHPGNLLVLPNAVIGVLDAGMVGRIDEELRDQIEDLLLGAVGQDTRLLLDAVVQLGEMPPDFDRTELKNDLLTFVDEYGAQSMDRFDLSGALDEMTAIIRRHHIILPARVSMLIKMLVMLEGTTQKLSPQFSLAELLLPYRAEAIKRRLSPVRFWRRLQSTHRDWSRLVESFPGDTLDILHRLRRGSMDIHLQHRRLDSIVNRLVMGILTAALFVGSASLWSSNVEPLLWGVSVPGALGCSLAMVLGINLIRAIHSSGDMRDSG